MLVRLRSLGVILYESLFGYPPFVSKSRNMTRQKVRFCEQVPPFCFCQ